MLGMQLEGSESYQQGKLLGRLSDPKDNVLGKLGEAAQSRIDVAVPLLDVMKSTDRLERAAVATRSRSR